MHKAKGLIGTMFSAVLHENVIPGSFWVPPQTKFLGDFTLAEVAVLKFALLSTTNLPATQRPGQNT